MYEVKVIKRFRDKENKDILREEGSVFTIKSDSRFRELMGENSKRTKYVELVKAHKKFRKTNGPKIILYKNYLYVIGGIETFIYNFVKHYKDRNITVITKTIDLDQIILLSNYCNIEVDNGKKKSADVIILADYDSDKALNRISGNKVYQMVHCDWEGMTKYKDLKNYKWKPHKKVDEVISVSKTAAKGLKKTMGIESKIIYNILDDEFADEDGLTFITLSRMTKEKGAERMLQMAKEFKKAGKHFTWFLCCTMEQITNKTLLNEIKSIPEFVFMEPNFNNKSLIKNCDYLVQLSDTESFCYSAYEALQRGVPVILTDFPEAMNTIKDGKNGYIIKQDMSNLDVEKIFNEIPKDVTYIDKCNHNAWEQVFNGEF